MTIRHLRVFIAVADTGKMSLAAQRLYIAQPTVSQAIAELESSYGVRLFERLSRKLYITAEGERLLDYARHIVALFDEMEEGMRRSGQRQIVRVGATITVGTCVLAPLVGRFEAENPQMRVKATIGNTAQIEEQICKSELDVGFVEGRVKSSDLAVRPVMEDELVLAAGRGHPFAGLSSVSLPQLRGKAFVLREKGSGTRALFDAALAKEGVSIEEKWVSSNSEAIKNAVIAGQGVTVISRRLIKQEITQGTLCEIALEGVHLVRQFCLITHKNKYVSEPLQRFLDICASGPDVQTDR